MLAMHHDMSSNLKVVGTKLKDLIEVFTTSLKMRSVVVELCNMIVMRGARLAASGIYGVLKKMSRDSATGAEPKKIVIAMDDRLYEHNTEYKKCLEITLRDLLGADMANTITFKHSNDRSGIRVALLAASHSQYLEDRS